MGEKRKTEQAFQLYLRGGERVCWHGATKSFPLLERDARFLILGKWIGTVLASGVILGLYIGNNLDLSVKVVGLVLPVAALLIDSPFLEKRSVLGQEYWITDQRAILMSRDKTFCSMELSNIDFSPGGGEGAGGDAGSGKRHF